MRRFSITTAILLVAFVVAAPPTAAAFPDLSYKAFDARFKKSSGRWRILIIWGSWCTTCAEDFGSIDRVLKERWKDQPIELWTISLDGESTEPQAEAILKGAGVKWETYSIESGAENEKILKFIDPKWNGNIPHFVVFDPKGERTLIRSGRMSGRKLDYNLTRLTGRKAAATRAEDDRILKEGPRNPPASRTIDSPPKE